MEAKVTGKRGLGVCVPGDVLICASSYALRSFDETAARDVTRFMRRIAVQKRKFPDASERFQQVEGKKIGLFGESCGALPIGSSHSIVGLREKAANFIDHVFLRGIELPAIETM